MKNPTPKIQLTILRTGRSLGAFLSLVTLACWGATPAAQADCREGCLTQANTVLGDDALFSLTDGNSNTAIGSWALHSNTIGSTNTAIGTYAMYWNTTGGQNTAIGYDSLVQNTTGINNTAIGDSALAGNTSGTRNTATGVGALELNTTGDQNTANGHQALIANTTGASNTAIGSFALFRNTTGESNIALGVLAGENLTRGNNNIYIDNHGAATESNAIRIGRLGTHRATYISGISGTTVPTGVAVIVDADGHLGTITSSRRYKEAIKPMDKSSEALLNLRPVTFRYKKDIDPQVIPQFGLVAEDVAKVDPDLVARDKDGKPYSVRYEAVNAMLLNEFLKEHRKVEELQATVEQMKETLEKVSARLNKTNP